MVRYVSFSNYSFEVLSENKTRFTMKQEVELKGALKLAGGLVRGKVRKQLKRSAESFKVCRKSVIARFVSSFPFDIATYTRNLII